MNAPTNRNMSFLDDDYEAERTKYTDPHTMKHTNIRKVSFRTIALVVLITCHFRKLSRYNQTTVHSKKKNTGNKKSKPIATDKSSSDIGCLQPIELLRHTTIDTSAVEQCQGAWEIGNNSIGLTNYMRKRRFSQYESPITVSLLLLERECDSSFSILNWKNCVLKQFNAMGSSFATSNSRFHMNSSATDGSSLLEAVVYQPSNRVRMHRTGHQTLDIIQNMRASLAVWNEQIRQTVVKNNELGNTLSSYEVKQSLQEKLLAEARASLKEQQHMVDRYKQQKLKEETDILSAIKKVHRAASGGDVSPIRETKSYFTPNSYTKTRKFQMNVVNSGHKPPPRSPERHSETKKTPISPIPVHPVRDETADFDDMMDAYLPNRFENSNS